MAIPNRKAVAEQVAVELGYPSTPGKPARPMSRDELNRYMDVLTARLAREDGSWGRVGRPGGRLGSDTLGYRAGQSGRALEAEVDVVRGWDGPDPRVQWLVSAPHPDNHWVAMQPAPTPQPPPPEPGPTPEDRAERLMRLIVEIRDEVRGMSFLADYIRDDVRAIRMLMERDRG